jgi:hypothetical protein
MAIDKGNHFLKRVHMRTDEVSLGYFASNTSSWPFGGIAELVDNAT